jgi:molybdenum cofactor biosynthesis enzyme MoaA
MNNQLKTAIWLSTWQCTLQCFYCVNHRSGITRQQSAVGVVAPEPIDCRKWIDTWNKYAPNKLVVTGGEPFLIPNMIDVLNGLTHIHEISVCTNLTHDVSHIVRSLKPRKCIWLTTACHPTQCNIDSFFDNIDKVCDKGFRTTVVFVAHPRQLHHLSTIRHKCSERNVELFVTPCIDPYHQVTHTPAEQQRVESITRPRKHHFINRIPHEKVKVCSGGYDYMCVLPNGDTFRCASPTVCIHDQDAIGNILEDDNVLLDAPGYVCKHGMCGSCDEDYVTYYDRIAI